MLCLLWRIMIIIIYWYSVYIFCWITSQSLFEFISIKALILYKRKVFYVLHLYNFTHRRVNYSRPRKYSSNYNYWLPLMGFDGKHYPRAVPALYPSPIENPGSVTHLKGLNNTFIRLILIRLNLKYSSSCISTKFVYNYYLNVNVT